MSLLLVARQMTLSAKLLHVGLAAVATTGVVSPSSSTSLTPACAEAPAAVYHVMKTDGVSLYTTNKVEADQAKTTHGFTLDDGAPFFAANSASSAMNVGVHRLFNAKTGDFAWYTKSSEISAATKAGYVDQGTFFYASSTSGSCRVPVTRYVKSGIRRFAVTAAQATALKSAGWTAETVAFYAGKPANSTTTAPATVTEPTGGTSTASPTASPTASATPTATATTSPTATATVSATTSPTATTSSTATPSPASTVNGGNVAQPANAAVGSLPVGQAAYPVPAGAIYVATTGNDYNPGTATAPVRTIAKAISVAPTNGTVVIRAGVYNEEVTVSRAVTIQNFPGEAVWMDGAVPATNWTKSGAAWTTTYTSKFDASPTYTFGAPDNTEAYWGFINPNFPMAAHPDMVFVDGVALKQVASAANVVAGSFAVNTANGTLVLGTDPSGKKVEVSNQTKAISLRAAGSVVRGIGVRRYATSVPMMGAVTMERDNTRLENVVITDIATQGVSFLGDRNVIDHVTTQNCGLLGVHGNYATNTTLNAIKATNNTETFNFAPVSGGIKFSKVRGFTVTNSDISNNNGPGLWIDESDYDGTIAHNTANGNKGTGISLEISAKMRVIDNQILGNGGEGLKVNNTSDVQIWNNTIAGSGDRNVNLVQDGRRNTDPNASPVDKRVAFPDATMPWTLTNVVARNNVISENSGNCLFCVEDYSFTSSAEQMGITADSNVYGRVTSPTWLVVWARTADIRNPYVMNTLADFTKITGQEKLGTELKASLVDAEGKRSANLDAVSTAKAAALPADLAAAAGQPVGTRYFGSWR